MLMSAGVVSLVASINVQDAITLFVQVVAVTLLPAALVFLILLLNDKPLMGEFVNTRWQNFVNWAIVLFVIVISTVYAVSVLFPECSPRSFGATIWQRWIMRQHNDRCVRWDVMLKHNLQGFSYGNDR